MEKGNSGEAECKQTGDVYNSDKIVNNLQILLQSSSDFVLTHNFQGTHILGASHGHLCNSTAFLFLVQVSCTKLLNRMQLFSAQGLAHTCIRI